MLNQYGFRLKEIISEEKIKRRIKEIGLQLSERYENDIPIFIGILNGSFIFMADLIRSLEIDCEMDFIKVESYSGIKSSGTVKLLKDISADITNRHVVIVEDIIDSGMTIRFLKERMKSANPASLSIVSLLMKPDIADLEFNIEYVGFEIPPEFVVGYGLDCDQKLRHLRSIYRLEGNIEKHEI